MTGSFVVAADHPSLAGHFPGQPIVPGVVLLDAVAAVLGVRPRGFAAVRFSRPVRPGDVVEVQGEHGRGEHGRFYGRVGGEMVVQGSIIA